MKVDEFPRNAPVLSANNGSIRNLTRVQTALEMAYYENSTEIYLSQTEYERTSNRFPHEYAYGGDSFGLYVTYRDEKFRVRVIEYLAQ